MGQNLTKTSLPTVAVIIVSFNDASNIERCLTSLRPELTDQVHVHLIDNSTDLEQRTKIAQICQHQPKVFYDCPKKNTGFAAGNNRALADEFAKGADYCFLLNSDTEIKAGSIAKLVTAQLDHEAALVAPKIVYGDRPNIFWYGGGRWQPWLGIVRHHRRNEPVIKQIQQTITFVNGCAMLIPKSTYDRIGGFFTPYFMYYEDSDYSVQLVKAGYKLLYEPQAVVKHFVPPITDKSPLALYYLTRNHWLFWSRTARGLSKITAAFAITIFQLIRFCRHSLHQTKRQAIICGWRDALKKTYGKNHPST